MFARIAFPVTVCILCYGSHHELARRCFRSLRQKTDPARIQLRLGLNAVCRETRDLAHDLGAHFPGTLIHDSDTNLYKMPMMRRLFHEPPIESEWTIWFDDDSHVLRADWLTSLAATIEAHPEVSMWGKTYLVDIDRQMMDFIRSASWYRGVPFPPSEVETGEPLLSFVTGGWWAIRTECLRLLDWPDPRLIHFHDDFLLCEALRQNGYRFASFLPGVRINGAERRAPEGTPFGFVGIARRIRPR